MFVNAGATALAAVTAANARTKLNVVADPGSNGLMARTSANASTARSITQPAAGITVANGDGVAGNPTLALANDLSALEGLGSTGIAVRTAADTWAQRSIAAGTGISVTNGDGVAGNPSIAVQNPMTGITVTNPANTDQTLTDAATIAWDMNSGAIGTVTLGAAGRTMGAPTNLKKGTYILHVLQDGTGNRTITTWNAVFKFQSATPPTLSTGAGKRDVFSFVCDGTNLYGNAMLDVR